MITISLWPDIDALMKEQSLSKKVKVPGVELKRLYEKITELEQKVSDTQLTIQSLTEENTQLKENSMAQSPSSDPDFNHSQKLHEKEEQIQLLQTQIASQKEKIHALENTLDLSSKSTAGPPVPPPPKLPPNQPSDNQIRELKKKMAQKDLEIVRATGSLNEKKKELEQMQNLLENKESQLNELQIQLEDAQEQINTLKSQIGKEQTSTSPPTPPTGELDSSLNISSSNQGNLETYKKQLEKEFELQRKDLEAEFEMQKSALIQEVERKKLDLQDDLEQKELMIKQLHEGVESLQEELASRNTHINDLEQQIQQNQLQSSNTQEFETKIEQLINELQNRNQQKQQLEEKLENLQMINQSLQHDIERLKSESVTKETFDHLKKENSELEKNFHIMSQNFQSMSSKFQEAKVKIQELEREKKLMGPKMVMEPTLSQANPMKSTQSPPKEDLYPKSVSSSMNATPLDSSGSISTPKSSFGTRLVCPHCGATGNKIKIREDKTQIISYIPKPVYKKIYYCSQCGFEFE